MSTENSNGAVTPDFFVKLPSDKEPTASEPGKSLVQEVELLRQQVQQLCTAVRGLVQLQSVANQKLDAVIKGNADCAVL
jgi:hypothetical protein